MPRFPEIEGLRAWLAWTVLVSHLFVVTNYRAFGMGFIAPIAGEYAVKIFVMISGFVIAGLVTDRQESWPRFIIRRAFRIFPAYWVALLAGAATAPLAISALARVHWGEGADFYFQNSLQGAQASVDNAPLAHWLLHLTLLQGLVPDDILPWSSVAFLGPAWSLSLEWQFYLVAPALVWAMRSPKWSVGLVILAFVLAELFRRGALGSYESYSTLAGGLWLFVIGIASRLALPTLKSPNLPVAALAAGAIGVSALSRDVLPIGLWIAFLIFLSRPAGAGAGAEIDRQLKRIASALFASPLATALGARSYSVYAIHVPVMKLLLFLIPIQSMTQLQVLGWLAPLAIVAVLIVSDLLYRFLERPMIRAGARLAALPRPSSKAKPQPAA